MGCWYSMSCIDIPGSARPQIEALIKEMEVPFTVVAFNGRVYLEQDDPLEMTNTDACKIGQEFLPRLAELLEGTECDDQMFSCTYEDDKYVLLLAGGKVTDLGAEPITLRLSEPVPVGEVQDRVVLGKLKGLPGGLAEVMSVEEQPTERYLIVVWGDIEPDIHGPYETDESRSLAARTLRQEEGPEHGIYGLDVVDGMPEVFSFSGGELEG